MQKHDKELLIVSHVVLRLVTCRLLTPQPQRITQSVTTSPVVQYLQPTVVHHTPSALCYETLSVTQEQGTTEGTCLKSHTQLAASYDNFYPLGCCPCCSFFNNTLTAYYTMLLILPITGLQDILSQPPLVQQHVSLPGRQSARVTAERP